MGCSSGPYIITHDSRSSRTALLLPSSSALQVMTDRSTRGNGHDALSSKSFDTRRIFNYSCTTTTYEPTDRSPGISSIKHCLSTSKPANDPALLNSDPMNPTNTYNTVFTKRNICLARRLARSHSPRESRRGQIYLLRSTPHELPSAL